MAPHLKPVNPSEEEQRELALVDELKAKHNITRVHVFTASTGETVYVRMPLAGPWRRFRSQVTNETKRADAAELLFRTCLLHPSQEAFDLMLEERPGLLDNFAGMLIELAGLERSTEKKVL